MLERGSGVDLGRLFWELPQGVEVRSGGSVRSCRCEFGVWIWECSVVAPCTLTSVYDAMETGLFTKASIVYGYFP